MTSRRFRIVVAVLLSALAAGTAALVLARSPGTSHQPGNPINGGARRLGPLTHGRIRFALNLRLRERALQGYLQHVHLSGRGSVSAARFGTRFGERDAQLEQLRRALRSSGIAIEHEYPQRTAILVSSSVAQLQSVFSLRFDRYVLPSGQRFFAPRSPPHIPATLAPYISGLGDLSNRPYPAADIPAGGLTPALTVKAYDIAPLWNAGIRGQGQTIAIVSAYGAINPADIQAFAKKQGIASPKIVIEKVNGGSPYNPAQGSDSEVDLDLQIVLGLAPDARIIDYQGASGVGLGRSFADLYNQVEQDGKAKIVSTSYGSCEPFTAAFSPGDQQLIDNSLKALEASGVTSFESTGDAGAYACLQNLQIQPASDLPPRFAGLSIQTPSSSPYSVAVGGTRLELRSDGSYLTESAWASPLAREGAGGGASATEPRPAWQQGPGVNQPAFNPRGTRQTPDVSGPADPNSGFRICGTPARSSTPVCGPGNGGTSAATPFWAASMLLVQQYAAAHGGGSLTHCFAAPILYQLAAQPQPVPAFHPIMRGNNGYYPATPGWSFAAGLGSPDVFNLAQDYAAFLRKQSAKQCPS